MIRFLASLAGIALIGYPPFLIYAITVPVPQFRTGSYADFLPFAATVSAIYGGVLLGIAVRWATGGKAWATLRPAVVFKAGVWGAVAVGAVFVIGAGVYGLTTQGSFEKGIGNLWGLILIFAALLGALVSAGVALLLHGTRPLSGSGRPT